MNHKHLEDWANSTEGLDDVVYCIQYTCINSKFSIQTVGDYWKFRVHPHETTGYPCFKKLTQKLDILPSSQPRHEGWRSQCEWYLLKLDRSLQHSWSESSPHRLAWRPEPFLVKPNPCPYDILEKNGGCFVRLLILIPISYAYITGFSCFIPTKKKTQGEQITVKPG